MPVTEIKRPNYYEGQYLGAQDLVAAQEYQSQQDQRHRLAAHTWGIGVGLELEERDLPGSSDAVDVYIKPGYVTDGFGRTMVVLEPYKIPAELFAQFTFNPALTDGQWIPVWLRYREQKTDPPRPGFKICSDQEQMYRVLETFRVVVGDLPSPTQQRDKISVAGKFVDADDELPDASIPYQALPDPGDVARWLIPLGSVRWLAPNPTATTVGHFVKSATDDDKAKARDGRRYIGVVAQSVLAPVGKLRIRDRSNPGPASNETADLVGIEGSLRVDGSSHLRGIVTTDSFLNIDSTNQNDGTLFPGPALTFGKTSFEGIASRRTASGNQNGLDFYTANAARLSITNDGKVGIGTTAPYAALTLTGSLGFTNANTPMMFIYQSGTNNPDRPIIAHSEAFPSHGLSYRDVGDKMIFQSSGLPVMVVDLGTRRVGIGATDADRALTIQGATGTYLNIKGDNGAHEVLLGVDVDGGIVSTMTNQDLLLRAGGNSTKVTIKADGNVGVGTSNPVQKLDVAGAAHASSFPTSSDDRLKTNVMPLENVLERVRKIRGVSFDWNENYQRLGRSTGKREIGVLGQEIQAAFPELVTKWGDENYLAVDYGRMTAVLIEALKELDAEVKKLQAIIGLLEKAESKSPKGPKK